MITYIDVDINNRLVNTTDDVLISPLEMDLPGKMYVFTPDAEIKFSKSTNRNKFNFFKHALFITSLDPDESMLYVAKELGCTGYITFSLLENELLSETSDLVTNIYSSKYATDEVLNEFTKPYGSEIHINKSIIPPSRLRSDRREFGLKFAKSGIYSNLVYFDWKNFYPNIMLELGCPRNLDRCKIEKLLSLGNTKFFLNKLIGRFDAEYSIYYNPEYANLLRRFGRMKLMYYAFKCDELIFCNTDSILARVQDNFVAPDNTSVMVVENALIKNIGNYVFYNNDEIKHTGIFNKPEELVIAKYRMGLNPLDEEFTLRKLFSIDEQGFISSDTTRIENLDRKCRYGKSNKLFKSGLVSIQENI